MSKKIVLLYVLLVIFFGINLDLLSQRVARLEIELKANRGVSAELASVISKTNLLQNILSQENFSGIKKIHVFRSPQSDSSVDDTFISNAPGQTDKNWGISPNLKVGYDEKGYSYRILLRFNELKKSLPKEIKILSATIYFKQHNNTEQDDNALHETINLYGVERKWAEGNKVGTQAESGDVTWSAAIHGQANWKMPGGSDPSEDIYKNILSASTGPHINGAGEGWVAFSFSSDGISRLMYRVFDDTKEDYGFLIQSSDEGKKNKTLISFYSSDYVTVSYRPYIEIIYVDLAKF